MRPCGAVVVAKHADARKAFVVAQIEVGFGPIISHEDLAVLKRAHRAGIDIQIGIKLQKRNLEPAGLQQSTHRRGGQPLPQ